MIHFYDKQRKLVMVMSNFVQNGGDIISCDVEVAYGGFSCTTSIEEFKCLFERFKDELVELYNGQRETANLSLMERQLYIDFKSLENGLIFCTLHLNHFEIRDYEYQSSLMTQYECDQSFLPELINEFDKVLL